MLIIEGRVGNPGKLGNGSPKEFRLGPYGELTTSPTLPRYTLPTLDGQAFSLDSDSVTLAAANATKGALATVKLVNGFYNPLGNNKNAVIIVAKVATVSGTPAGPFFYNYLTGVVVTSAATGTIRPTLLSGSNPSKMIPQVNVIVTISGGATTALIQLETIGGPAAIAAGAGMYDVKDLVDGRIIVPPGCIFGIAATGVGTTHIVQSSLGWLEVDI